MTYAFGAGNLVTEDSHAYSTFMGFPSAWFVEFDSGQLVADAVEVNIVDLARWFWRVRSWSVVFGAVLNANGFEDDIYTSTAANELEIATIGWEWQANLNANRQFSARVVIEPGSGRYGLSSDIEDNFATIVSFVSGAGATLTFSDGSNTVTATENTYWEWLPVV